MSHYGKTAKNEKSLTVYVYMSGRGSQITTSARLFIFYQLSLIKPNKPILCALHMNPSQTAPVLSNPTSSPTSSLHLQLKMPSSLIQLISAFQPKKSLQIFHITNTHTHTHEYTDVYNRNKS